jgi:uncharacterized protein YxeA
MKLTFAVIAAVMAVAAPVMAQQEPEVKYHIKYVDSTDETHNDLKNFNLQGDNKSAKYKNDSYSAPKFFIKEKETNNFFKKAN